MIEVVLYLSLSILVGHLLHRFVELPSIELRNKMFPDEKTRLGSKRREAMMAQGTPERPSGACG